jgi:subtilisin family serine protease
LIRFASAVLAAAVLVLAAAAGSAAGTGADRYIVVLKSGTDSGAVAAEHGRRYGAQVSHVYGHAIAGYAATIANDRVASVRRDSRVAYVERDGTVTATVQALPWGIDKIDADVSSTLAGNGNGAVSNVNAYVIDTGIDGSHPDLNVVGNVNFAGGPNKDCNGHGTHVAGTIAARDNTSDVVGVAPGAPLTGVRVLGCGGSGSYSGVIAGIDWVTANAVKPAVANMSLGGPANQALDDAVGRSATLGITYAVAAGNDGADACSQSPARAGAGTNNGIVTTAATDQNDREASWSNDGSCVDIWAPGVSILSTRKGGGTTTMSGTSMASPHVAGGAALYLSRNTGSASANVESALKNTTSTGGTSKDGASIRRLTVSSF